jgi:hypothetical protein
MPRESTAHEDRSAKAAEAKDRAAARETAKCKSFAPSDEEFRERIAAYNRENPRKEIAKQMADKYIARDGGPPVAETRIDDEVRAAISPTEEKEIKTEAAEINRLRRSAAHIIGSKNVLDLFAGEFGKVIAGEQTNGKLLYLVSTSRLFDRTMHAAIKGTSAGGKSEIGGVVTSDETVERTWFPLFSEMLSTAFENANRRRFPERALAAGAKR